MEGAMREREREYESTTGTGAAHAVQPSAAPMVSISKVSADRKAEAIRQFQLQQQAAQQRLAEARRQAAAAADDAPPSSAGVQQQERPIAAMMPVAALDASQARRQKEIYVGNLAVGMVTPQMLQSLFNQALMHLVAGMMPPRFPVTNVNLDPSGKFGFIEMLSDDMANAALSLDKVQLCGRSMNVGRPKGYMDPVVYQNLVAQQQQQQQQQQQHAAATGANTAPLSTVRVPQPPATGVSLPPPPPPPPASLPPQAPPQTAGAKEETEGAEASLAPATTCVLLENIVPIHELKDDSERAQIEEEITEECETFGKVAAVAIPMPSLDSASAVARVYVRFEDEAAAGACLRKMDGRRFDGNLISARHVDEAEFDKAKAGAWI